MTAQFCPRRHIWRHTREKRQGETEDRHINGSRAWAAGYGGLDGGSRDRAAARRPLSSGPDGHRRIDDLSVRPVLSGAGLRFLRSCTLMPLDVTPSTSGTAFRAIMRGARLPWGASLPSATTCSLCAIPANTAARECLSKTSEALPRAACPACYSSSAAQIWVGLLAEPPPEGREPAVTPDIF